MELFQQRGTLQKSAASVDESKVFIYLFIYLYLLENRLSADNNNISDDGNIHVWPDEMQYVHTYLIF